VCHMKQRDARVTCGSAAGATICLLTCAGGRWRVDWPRINQPFDDKCSMTALFECKCQQSALSGNWRYRAPSLLPFLTSCQKGISCTKTPNLPNRSPVMEKSKKMLKLGKVPLSLLWMLCVDERFTGLSAPSQRGALLTTS